MPEHDRPPAGEAAPAAEAPTAAPPARPSRRRLRLGLAAAAVAGATALGVAFADNVAALGAYRYQPPPQYEGLMQAADGTRAKRAWRTGGDSGVSATTCRSTDDRRMVFVTVAEMHVFLPGSQLDEAIAAQRENGCTCTDLHDVDPGGRGGVMKCGRALVEEGGLSVCTWADGSMWASLTEVLDGTTVDPDVLAERARAFRVLAEVPARGA
ncbi:hypothetical protein ABTX81_21955 [Kitasatospora sp. NPDC097605]|uniref:hypothetical protein n=1 Tax=Kitasatospora sp. NPDC097605 TaxID=3157226 RepID=UPI003330D6DC